MDQRSRNDKQSAAREVVTLDRPEKQRNNKQKRWQSVYYQFQYTIQSLVQCCQIAATQSRTCSALYTVDTRLVFLKPSLQVWSVNQQSHQLVKVRLQHSIRLVEVACGDQVGDETWKIMKIWETSRSIRKWTTSKQNTVSRIESTHKLFLKNEWS